MMGQRKRTQPDRLNIKHLSSPDTARRYWTPRIGHVGRRPQVDEDILVFTGDAGPVEWQPARIVRVRELVACGGAIKKHKCAGVRPRSRYEFDVAYYGWDKRYNETVKDERIRPMVPLYVTQCKALVQQVEEVMPAFLAGKPKGWVRGAGPEWVEASSPGEGFVRHKQLPEAGLCSVVDVAVRQMEKNGRMTLAYCIEYKLDCHDKHNGWVDASMIDLSAPPPATLAEGDCLPLDISERECYLDHEDEHRGVDSIRVQLERNTLWVALEDFTMFATSWGPGEGKQGGRGYSKWQWPAKLEAKFQVKKMRDPAGGSPQETKVVPAHLLDAVTQYLPWTATERFRQHDSMWLRDALRDELAKIGRQELLEQSTVCVTNRRFETLWFEVDEAWMPIDLVTQLSHQPMLSSQDLVNFIRGRKLHAAEARVWQELCGGPLRRFQQQGNKAVLKLLHLNSDSATTMAIAGDNIESIVVTALKGLERNTSASACALREAMFCVRQKPRWLKLRDALNHFGVEDAPPTDLGDDDDDADEAKAGDDQYCSSHGDDTQLMGATTSDEEQQGCGDVEHTCALTRPSAYQPVRWEELQPLKRKLDVAEWTEQSESVVPKVKGKSGAATALFSFNYESVERVFCEGPKGHPERKLDPQQISDVLCGHTKPEQLVGIGEITDEGHPVRKSATQHGYNAPVYLVYAKRQLPYGTVLGEVRPAPILTTRDYTPL